MRNITRAIEMDSNLPILTFHSIDDLGSINSFPTQLFQRCISKLSKAGYKTIGLMEAIGLLRMGKSIPDRSFIITFDDGYQNVYAKAFPVLEAHGMTATIFLTVGNKKLALSNDRLPSFCGNSMLSWNEIRSMSARGFSFGAHTLSHPDLTTLNSDQIEKEIRGSKEVIENALGEPVLSFSYPYGRYNTKCIEIVRRLFTCACTDRLGLVAKGCDPYTLARVETYYMRSECIFDMMKSNLFPWYIKARGIPRRIRRKIIPFRPKLS